MDVLDIARFWSKVDVKLHGECWPWRGVATSKGYGEMKVDGATKPSHRIAFEAAYGAIPAGYVVRHTCDNPLCCNPTHLLTGTHADNVRDRVIRGRSAKGENAGRAKLTDEKVREMRALQGVPAMEIATRYGVCLDTVYKVRGRKIWTHI